MQVTAVLVVERVPEVLVRVSANHGAERMREEPKQVYRADDTYMCEVGCRNLGLCSAASIKEMAWRFCA